MSELREAAKAALTAYEKFRDVDDIDGLDDAMDRLRAALAQPEAPCYVGDARKHVICVCPDCVATNYREWCEAVHAELVTTWTFSAENKDDPRKALQDIINWHVSVSLDPAVSSDAQALIERGKAMRDEWRLASEPPDSDRDVQAWIKIDLSELDGVVTEQCDAQAFYEDGVWHVRGPDHDGWMQLCPGHMVSVVVWRDVTPPTTEGE